MVSVPLAARRGHCRRRDRPLLTRRDIERLFGVGKVRAAALMKTIGAELVGNQRTRRGRSSCSSSRSTGGGPRSASRRRDARAPGRRPPAGPADWVPVQGARRDHERGRIEVRFDGAEDALARLYALAQPLGRLVDEPAGERVATDDDRGSGGVARRAGDRDGRPPVIIDAGPQAAARLLEFFAGRIANARARAAYGRSVGRFLAWCAARGPRAVGRLGAPRGRLHPDAPGIGPDREAASGRDPHARRLASSSARSSH